MPNTRSGGASRDGCGRISGARGNAGRSYLTRACTSGNPALLAVGNGAHERAMDAPRLPACGGSDMLSSRRLSDDTPTPSQGRCPPRLINAAPLSLDKQQKGVAEVAFAGMPQMVRDNASNSSLSRVPSSACSKEGAEEHITGVGRVSSLSKKRKRMDTKAYRALFTPSKKANSTDVVVGTTDRAGKENTSSSNVVGNNTGMLCEGRMMGKNKRHPSDPVYKFSRSLHETPQMRSEKCSVPLPEVQQQKSIDACPQHETTESRISLEGRDQPTGHARQNSVSSLRNTPISLTYYDEPESRLGDGEPNCVQKEGLASRQFKVTLSDETEGNSNICIACGTPGDIKPCDGKGCKRSYHISCLDNWLEYFSPGIWFCTICTKKRLLSGIHSIADEIESLWNVKEWMHNDKLYLVKYKNLAHVHNRWIPEGVIKNTPGGCDLLSLFNKRDHNEKTSWKKEWMEPHRLLRKRLLMLPKEADNFFGSTGSICEACNVEWLVKWRDLGYDQATWELETSHFLRTPQADELKKKYENRLKAAKQWSTPTETKVKQNTFQKLQRLPDEWPPGFDNDHLFSINQLREFWGKSHGAVLVDDKEYVTKAILFTLTVLPDVSQPFLIVTTPASLSAWEVQFNHLAPFVNVVVYDGRKDTLKLIQDLEFYENGSCMMLQVLLSHPDAILEDSETTECIHWEAVIVDYCEDSALKYLEQLKKLSANFRMVLLRSPIKDNLPEYMGLLAFLNSEEKDHRDCVDADDALAVLKTRFTRHIAYECKGNSLEFLEYWVPSYISQVQLEIYCSILLSNASVLQSQMKTDNVGALHDIYLSLKKCCDHPYLVDEYLQSSLNNDSDVTENMDAAVHASGKLLLLDKMLEEIMKKRLRVIVLFQSRGAGRNTVGHILERFMRHRFGPESYEHIEYGSSLPRKHAVINKFNDKTSGRFVFLLENCLCHPSIKLSSIDAIIIYGTDNNPLNDLKALQRIKIDSQFEHVSIFRFYTPFTVEEKSLVLAKQGILIDNNIQGLRPSIINSLLSWGSSFLFTRLDEVQQDNRASKSSEMDTPLVDEVIFEFLTKLCTNAGGSTKVNKRSISEANMSGELYSRNITLIGEKKGISVLEEDPAKFWLNLLDGRSPRWSYISEPLQSRIRKSETMDEAKIPTEETDDARKKRRKAGEVVGSSSEVLSGNRNDDALPEICTTSCPALLPVDDTQQKSGLESLMSTPKNLHVHLKEELSKLVEMLQLPDNVRLLVGQFFESLLKNHLVAQEPKGILHALNIALCWRAASLLNFKVDHRVSLTLAEKNLKYECNEELARLAYDKLRILKKNFPQKAGAAGAICQSTPAESTKPSQQETSTDLRNGHVFPKQRMDLHDDFMNGALQGGSFGAVLMVPEEQELIAVPGTQEGSCGAVQMVQEEQELITVPGTQEGSRVAVQMVPEEQELIDVPGAQEGSCGALQMVPEEQELIAVPGTQEGSCAALQMVPEEQELITVPETQRKCDLSTDELPDYVKKRIDLIDNAFSLRVKKILDKQQSEISELLTHRYSKTIRLKEVRNLVLEHIHRSQIYAETRNETIKRTVMWFFMLMHRFLEHMAFQCNKLRALQSNTWSRERQLKEKLLQEAKSGYNIFDEKIAIPDSNFVMEEFVLHINGSPVSNCLQLCHDRLDMEITLVQNVVPSESISSNGPVEAIMVTGRPASEVFDFPENNCCSSGDIGVQRASCSSITIPSNRDSINQESSTSEFTSTENVGKENANKSTLLGCATSLVKGVDANNVVTVAVDHVNVESTMLASPQDLTTLSVSREVGTQTNLSTSSALRTVGTSQHPYAEAEPTENSGVMMALDLQPEMQTPTSTLDSPFQRMCQDDNNQTVHQPDTSTGPMQEDTSSCHLALTDANVGVVGKNDETASADPLDSETQCYTAVPKPAALLVAREVETQIDQSSMLEQQSTSLPLPPKQSLPSQHQPAQPEPANILGTETAPDMQPEMQPSASMLDAPPQKMHLDNSSQTKHQAEASPDLSQKGGTSEHLGDAQKEVDANTSNTIYAVQSHLESPNLATPKSLAIFPVLREVGTQGNISNTQKSTDLSAQQNVAPLQHPSAEAEQTFLLITQVAQDLQPEMQPSTSLLDAPVERNNRSQTDCQPDRTAVFSQEVATTHHSLGDARAVVNTINADNIAKDPLNSESPTDVMHRPAALAVLTEVETQTCQSSMPVLQSISQSVQQSPATARHTTGGPVVGIEETQKLQPSISGQDQPAETEQEGMLSPAAVQDLQPEMQPPNLVQDKYAGTEQEGMLSTAAAQDLRPEMQSSVSLVEADQEGMLSAAAARNMQPETQRSTSMHDASFERTGLSDMPVQQNITVSQSAVPSCNPHTGVESTNALCMETTHELQSELQPSSSMQDRPAEAVVMSCTMTAYDLEPQMEMPSTVRPDPPERARCEYRNQVGVGPNTAPGPEQSTQPLPVAPIMFNHPSISEEPLKNELERLKHWGNIFRKAHEQKKTQLQIEYNQEIEKVKMKYDSLVQKEDYDYSQKEAALDSICKKVSINHSFAEKFREQFMRSSAAQGRSMRPTMGQPVHTSQQPSARILAVQVTASPVSSLSATQPQVFHSPEPYAQPSLVFQPSSLRATQPESILPSNIIHRAISSPFSTTPLPIGCYGTAGTQSHAPAPHLQQLRMPPPHAMVCTNQQQLHVGPGVTSLRQFVPGIMENFSSTSPQAGSLVTSMAPNSGHQTMQTISSASNSHPAIPGSSLLSGPLPELMVNPVLPSSSNPSLTALQSANMVLHSTSGPLNVAARSQHAGAEMSSASYSASESASLDAWLTSRLGLTCEPRGTGGTTEVVCLSDDES